jgi:hypothetical protein
LYDLRGLPDKKDFRWRTAATPSGTPYADSGG